MPRNLYAPECYHGAFEMPSFTVIRFLSLSVFNLGDDISMVGGIDLRYREKVVMLLLGFIKNLLFKD